MPTLEESKARAGAARLPQVRLAPIHAGRRIPRVLHQTFHTRGLPEPLAANVRAARDMNPDWDCRFYDEADVRRFIARRYGPACLDHYDAIAPEYHAARSDLFRYMVMFCAGGIYLDVKSAPTRPFSEVLLGSDQFLISQWRNQLGAPYEGWGLHPELAGVSGGEFQQWYIAAVPGHPFLAAVIERVMRNIRRYNPGLHGVGRLGVLRVTGPIAYTLAIEPLRREHPHRIVDSRADLGFEYSIFGPEGHKAVLGGHYSELADSIVQVGQATRASALLIGALKAARRGVRAGCRRLRAPPVAGRA